MRSTPGKPRYVVTVLACLALLPGVAQAGAAGPALVLHSREHHPGAMIEVSGVGFGSVERVRVEFDVEPVAHAVTDAGGAFTARFLVPSDAAPGIHRVTSVGRSSGLRADARFRVITDWPKFHSDATGSGTNPYENTLSPSSVSGLAQRWSFATLNLVQSSPVISRGVLYVGSYDHAVYALDAVTGTKLWRFTTGSVVTSSPAVANGVVYVGSWGGKVYALGALSGSELWSSVTVTSIIASPAVANGLVYIGADAGLVYAFGL